LNAGVISGHGLVSYHDGKADVLLKNASGAVGQWQMKGDHIDENVTVGSHSTDWHMV
jgi:hypothetical protein